jgi:hypothetical protein
MPDAPPFVLHPWIARRKEVGPPKVADISTASVSAPWYRRFNAFLALRITQGVGTMWCAYAFAGLALVSLPSAIRSGSLVTIVSWISQTFLQLVLLSIIIVGQNIMATSADRRSEATYEDATALLHITGDIERHLAAQDAQINAVLGELARLRHS